MRCMGRMGFGMYGVAVRARGLPARRAVAAFAVAALGATLAQAPHASADAPPPGALYLVTLDGPGTAGYVGPLPSWIQQSMLLDEQQQVLDAVQAGPPVYQWTAALNGFAARLTADQADA